MLGRSRFATMMFDDGSGVGVADGFAVAVGVAEGFAVAVGVAEGLAEPVAVADGVGDGAGVTRCVGGDVVPEPPHAGSAQAIAHSASQRRVLIDHVS
jgi:hypothetical protein